jgi:NAD-dependent deacetylase
MSFSGLTPAELRASLRRVGTVARDGTAEGLAELIRESRRTVALTGAGISVPSGIPDFRTPGSGVWEKADPMEVAHIDAFRRDPERFWSFYRPRFQTLGDKQPNGAHLALAQLEAQGFLEAVVTQNIDRLHRKAGTQNLIEVHGSIDTSTCTDCRASYPLESVEELFTNGVAHCQSCQGLVKPDVVLFGELLPEKEMHEAQALAECCELMLCVGSSLEVYPVAGLPSIARASGAKLAIVTQGPTPYDDEAEVKLDGDVVEEMAAVLDAL